MGPKIACVLQLDMKPNQVHTVGNSPPSHTASSPSQNGNKARFLLMLLLARFVLNHANNFRRYYFSREISHHSALNALVQSSTGVSAGVPSSLSHTSRSLMQSLAKVIAVSKLVDRGYQSCVLYLWPIKRKWRRRCAAFIMKAH